MSIQKRKTATKKVVPKKASKPKARVVRLNKLTANFWKDLDLKCKDPNTGWVVRLNALEWLRCESLRIAYPTEPVARMELKWEKRKKRPSVPIRSISTPLLHDMSRSQPHDALLKELISIRAEHHHRLFEKMDNLKLWNYPYWTPSLRKAFAVEVMEEGVIERDPRRVVLRLSMDLTQPEAVLQANFKQIIQQEKHGKRAPGGGRGKSLLLLWDALTAMGRWMEKNDIKQSTLGFEALSSKVPRKSIGSAEKLGFELVALGKEMVFFALNEPQGWLDEFF